MAMAVVSRAIVVEGAGGAGGGACGVDGSGARASVVRAALEGGGWQAASSRLAASAAVKARRFMAGSVVGQERQRPTVRIGVFAAPSPTPNPNEQLQPRGVVRDDEQAT